MPLIKLLGSAPNQVSTNRNFGTMAWQDASGVNILGGTATLTSDASINGLTIGKGGGNVSTNTTYGAGALALNNTGLGVTAVGSLALSKSTASGGTATGTNAGFNVTSGANNTFYGNSSGYGITTGNGNVFIGSSSGYYSNGFVANSVILGGFQGSGNQSNYLWLSDGAGNVRQVIDSLGGLWQQQTVSAQSSAFTITAALLRGGIITYSGATAAATFDTGANIDGTSAQSITTGTAITCTLINTGVGTVTLTASSGVTIVGFATILSGTSATFKLLKTATNTFVTYRI